MHKSSRKKLSLALAVVMVMMLILPSFAFAADLNITAVRAKNFISWMGANDLAGAKAMLPATIKCTLSDGSAKYLPVTWSATSAPAFDGDAYGNYVFTGDLTLKSGITNTNNLKARATVKVRYYTIASVPAIDKSVANGTTLDAVKAELGNTVKVNLSDGTQQNFDVIWSSNCAPAKYNPAVAGTYTLGGQVRCPANTRNPLGLRAQVNITVGEAQELQVVSVAALTSKVLGVTFNRELTAAEKAAAVFAFTYAGNPIAMTTVTWDGKVAKVGKADSSVLGAGVYGVTVTGLDATVTGSGTIAAEAATSIQITTDRVNPAVAQALIYTVKDQYGDDMVVAPANITVTAYNLTAPARAAVVTTISNISFAACNPGDVVRITAYLTADTNVKVVKDITVANLAVGSIALGTPTLPAGTARFYANTVGVIIPVTATDNYGSAMNLQAGAWATGVATADGLIPTFAASDFAAVAVNADGNLAVTLPAAAGTATLTITNPASGGIVTKTITVVAAPDTATIAMTAPADPVRMGAASAIPFTLTDQFGDAMTVASAGWATADVTLSSTNVGVATVAWAGNVLTVTPVATGTTTIFATVVTPVATAETAVNSLTITVNAAKAPTYIAVSGTPKTDLAQGETVLAAAATGALKYAITDQDGAAIDLIATGVAGVKANLTITDPSGVLAAPAAQVLMAADMSATVGTTNGITVTANAVNGTATVTVQLFNDANADDVMGAGEAMAGAIATTTYTVSSPSLNRGAITNITVLTPNADFSAAQGPLTSASVLTYALQDQAGNALTTTAATNVNWTVTNTGANAITVNDGAAKTLAAGATATYTTVAAAGAAAKTTLTITSNNEDKVNVSVAAAGVATPATTSLYYTNTVMGVSQTYNGTIVAFDKTANWIVIQTSIGYVVVKYQDAAVFTGTIGFTVDGNTAAVAAFETALTLNDTVVCTSNATDLTVALTNH